METAITHRGSNRKNLKFDYDAMGNRIAKHVLTQAGSLEKSTYYILDASGNTMSVYEREINSSSQSVSYAQTERHIYGSKRLGTLERRTELLSAPIPHESTPDLSSIQMTANVCTTNGKWYYELGSTSGSASGNVVTFTDPNMFGAISTQLSADVVPGETYTMSFDLVGLNNIYLLGYEVRNCVGGTYFNASTSTTGHYQATFTVPLSAPNKIRIKWLGYGTVSGTPINLSLKNIVIDGPGIQFIHIPPTVTPSPFVNHRIGERHYELSDHRGNVNTVISDIPVPFEEPSEEVFTLFNDEFTTDNDPMGWSYSDMNNGMPPSPGYSLTVSGGQMTLTCGDMYEAIAKYVDVPDGSNYTVSFDVTAIGSEPVYFYAEGKTGSIFAVLTTTGSYSYSDVGHSASELMTFIFENAPANIQLDNIKVIYNPPPTVLYMADIRQAVDFSAFGVQLQGRNLTLNGIKDYSLGFQGQEEDDEISGEGNSVNFKYRMHSPRVGRFFTIDPLASKYPFYSPYAFSGNRVVDCVELEGREPKKYTAEFLSTSTAGFGKEKEHTFSSGLKIWTADDAKYWVYYQFIGQQEISANHFQYYAIDPSDPDYGKGWKQFSPKSRDETDAAYTKRMADFSTAMSKGFAEVMTAIGTGGLGFEAGVAGEIGEAAVNVGMDLLNQGVANNCDGKDIDYADAALSGLFSFSLLPGGGYSKAAAQGISSGLVDVNYDKGIEVSFGNDKSPSSILIDAGFNTLGGLGKASFGEVSPGFSQAADFVTGASTNAAGNATNKAVGNE